MISIASWQSWPLRRTSGRDPMSSLKSGSLGSRPRRTDSPHRRGVAARVHPSRAVNRWRGAGCRADDCPAGGAASRLASARWTQRQRRHPRLSQPSLVAAVHRGESRRSRHRECATTGQNALKTTASRGTHAGMLRTALGQFALQQERFDIRCGCLIYSAGRCAKRPVTSSCPAIV